MNLASGLFRRIWPLRCESDLWDKILVFETWIRLLRCGSGLWNVNPASEMWIWPLRYGSLTIKEPYYEDERFSSIKPHKSERLYLVETIMLYLVLDTKLIFSIFIDQLHHNLVFAKFNSLACPPHGPPHPTTRPLTYIHIFCNQQVQKRCCITRY